MNLVPIGISILLFILLIVVFVIKQKEKKNYELKLMRFKPIDDAENEAKKILDAVSKEEKERLDKVLKNNNLVFLPTKLAPDQLLFEFFYNLPADDPYWKNNPIKLTKPVFKKIANEIITQLNIEGETIDLYEYIKNHKNDKSETNKLRDLFKNFNTNSTIEKLISGKIEFNPYAVWAKRNKSETEIFVNRMRESLKSVLSNGHHISDTLIEAYFIE
ncbi:hypothetical protein M0L11_RS16265 [Providencia rettgeri]|nr:hypothetical protein [Providencia rettgeri]